MQPRLVPFPWYRRGVAMAAAALILAAVTTDVSAQQHSAPEQGAASAFLTGVVVVSATTTTPTAQNAYVYSQSVGCPTGLTVIGGGAQIIDATGNVTDGGGVLTNSFPMGNPPTGWSAAASSAFGESHSPQGAGITVFALCAQFPTVFVPTAPNGTSR